METNRRGRPPATPQSAAIYELMEIQASARAACERLEFGGELGCLLAQRLIRTIAPAACRAQHYLDAPRAA